MKGRIAKPSALKALQGHAGHRTTDGRVELTMPEGTPEPPAHLSPGASQEWFRTVRWLMQVRGLLSPTDHAAIGIYCSYYDQWQQAEQDLPRLKQRLEELEDRLDNRKLTKKKRTDLEKQAGRCRNTCNTTLGERNKARREMRSYLSELGLTPAARARIRVPSGQGELPLGDQPETPFQRAARGASA